MTVAVRLAERGDQNRLAELDPWPDEHVWPRKIDGGEVYVAEANGIIVGALRWESIWTTVAFVSHIVVDKRYRGLGISRQLLDRLKRELKSRGAPALLSSTQTDDVLGQSWHGHMGFKRNGLIENIADEGVGEIFYRTLL